MRMRSERMESLALAVLLSIGAGVVWGCLWGLGLSIVGEMVTSGEVREQLLFVRDGTPRDGTPIIESYVGRDYANRTFRTLNGKEIKLDRYSFDSGAFLAGPKYQKEHFGGLQWRERIVCIENDWFSRETWYFVHDGELEGHGYIVGYDKKAKAKIGYIGRGGFVADEPPLHEQFPVNGRRMSSGQRYGGTAIVYGSRDLEYLLTEDGLMEINLRKRSAAVFRKGGDLLSASNWEMPRQAAGKATEALKAEPRMLLRTPDRVVVLTSGGKEIESYPLPPALRELNLQWIELPGGKAIARESFAGSELFWLDTNGKIARRERVEWRTRRPSELMDDVTTSVAMPCPALIAGIIVCYPWGPADCPESLEYSAALRKAFAKAWPILLATGIVGAVLACVCYRRQRRYGLAWTGLWTVLVLLFGLPAYFGYLAHRSWPARLPCPHCGRSVPRDRAACFVCGREFPAPPPKGIEVFERKAG
jgi:hypothetical protein